MQLTYVLSNKSESVKMPVQYTQAQIDAACKAYKAVIAAIFAKQQANQK